MWGATDVLLWVKTGLTHRADKPRGISRMTLLRLRRRRIILEIPSLPPAKKGNCFTSMNFVQPVEVIAIAAGITGRLSNRADELQHFVLRSLSTHVEKKNTWKRTHVDVYLLWGTYTTHIPVMVKTGRLTGRIIHRDMTTTRRSPLQRTTNTSSIKDLQDSDQARKPQSAVVLVT